MKALFLAGGKGTRLRPLTDKLPKPMVPVMGKPLLERTIKKLKRHGVDEVVLSTCYRADYIKKYFSRVNTGVQIRYVTEETPLGTGGAIKNGQRFFKETFFIFNADIIAQIDFNKMRDFHKRKKADVTIAATYVEDPTPYGVIEFDKDNWVETFREKPKPHEVVSHYINAGIYIFEPEILEMIPSGRVVSVEREIFPKLLAGGKRVAVYRDCAYWIDLGTPEKYMRLHRDIFAGKYRVEEADFKAEPVAGKSKARIHPSAVLRGPVFLNEGVHIGAGAVVGPNVVLGAGCTVGEDCVLDNSIIWDKVVLEEKSRVSGSVITADCFVPSGTRIIKSIYTGEAQRDLAVS